MKFGAAKVFFESEDMYLPGVTVVFEISYISTLLPLLSRKINPRCVYGRRSLIARPLPRIVSVFYNTHVRPRRMYFTRNRYTCSTSCPSFSFPCGNQSTSPILAQHNMAPRLPVSKLHLIRDMIQSQSFTTSRMAEEAEYSKLTIINIRRNLRQFGSIYTPKHD